MRTLEAESASSSSRVDDDSLSSSSEKVQIENNLVWQLIRHHWIQEEVPIKSKRPWFKNLKMSESLLWSVQEHYLLSYNWAVKVLCERRENEELTTKKKVCRKGSLQHFKTKSLSSVGSLTSQSFLFSFTCFTEMDNLIAISYTHKKAAPNTGVKQIWL